jgi:hypothetical protein
MELTPEDMRLYRVHKTVLKMLSKRGYNVLEESLNASPQAFLVRAHQFRGSFVCWHVPVTRGMHT